MKKTLLFLAVILTASMNAQTNFTATDDVYVQGEDPEDSENTTNYNLDGGVESAELLIKKGGVERLFRKTLIKFDLTAAGLDGDDVVNARLKLYVSDVQKKASPAVDPVTVTVFKIADDTWVEGTVTWNSAPATGAKVTEVAGIDKDAIGTDKYFTVTDYVKTELDGNKIISFILEDLADPLANNTITFASKADVVNGPTLIINDPALSTSNFDVQNNVVSLYPNPAQDSFEIQTPNVDISNVKVFSINGSMLYNVNNVNSKSLTVDTSAFQTGVYFVHIKNALGALSVQKIIKN